MAKNNFDKIENEISTMTDGRKQIAMNLLDKARFHEVELGKLQKILEVKGWTEEYKNGANQFGLKKCSEGEVYIALTKNYTNIMKQLQDMLGKAGGGNADELMEFLKR